MKTRYAKVISGHILLSQACGFIGVQEEGPNVPLVIRALCEVVEAKAIPPAQLELVSNI